MMFRDRKDAGRKLATRLLNFRNARDAIIIALPRGGVVVGYEIAQTLELPLDVVCPRKIGAPFNPEFAIGAVTEMGDYILSIDVVAQLHLSQEELVQLIDKEKKEAQSRLQRYRKGRPPRNLINKQVLLVDDGLATGSTMKAAIETVRASKASTIILAVPVSPPDTLDKLRQLVDQIVCLSTPKEFYAVGQFYEHFEQVTDEEVINLLREKSK